MLTPNVTSGRTKRGHWSVEIRLMTPYRRNASASHQTAQGEESPPEARCVRKHGIRLRQRLFGQQVAFIGRDKLRTRSIDWAAKLCQYDNKHAIGKCEGTLASDASVSGGVATPRTRVSTRAAATSTSRQSTSIPNGCPPATFLVRSISACLTEVFRESCQYQGRRRVFGGTSVAHFVPV
jgi:hypothetical protein